MHIFSKLLLLCLLDMLYFGVVRHDGDVADIVMESLDTAGLTLEANVVDDALLLAARRLDYLHGAVYEHVCCCCSLDSSWTVQVCNVLLCSGTNGQPFWCCAFVV